MSTSGTGAGNPRPLGLYDANYSRLTTELYSAIRREIWGDDLGQSSWLTVEELEGFITWLAVGPTSRVLDVACGSGGIAARVAEKSGCAVVGMDLNRSAVEQARAREETARLGSRARFEVGDASQALPFADGSFDAVLCIDAINHLPDRARVLAEWRRVLRPGGRLLFTDPIVVSGLVSNREIAVRASIGFFLFAAPGEDERLVREAGFELLHRADATENMAVIAERWGAAREKRAGELRAVEGDSTYEGQQEFLRVAATLARERRLSRVLVVAEQR